MKFTANKVHTNPCSCQNFESKGVFGSSRCTHLANYDKPLM